MKFLWKGRSDCFGTCWKKDNGEGAGGRVLEVGFSLFASRRSLRIASSEQREANIGPPLMHHNRFRLWNINQVELNMFMARLRFKIVEYLQDIMIYIYTLVPIISITE
jgi:hypothetical protein